MKAKVKHLFLNEDDVETYITYPPKDDSELGIGKTDAKISHHIVPKERLKIKLMLPIKQVVAQQQSSSSLGMSPSALIPDTKDQLLEIQDSRCMMSKKPVFN